MLVTLADPQVFNEMLLALGHGRADAFLRAGAQRLTEVLGVGTSIYHVDVLSFAFRLPGNAEPGSPAMIDRIVAAFREPVMCDDVPFDTRIGIGLRGIARFGSSPGEDLRAALAASQDSRGVRRGWSWFDRKRDEAHRRAFRLLSDLKSALTTEGQLELHYQPKVRLASGACTSVEALLRWTHPQLGPVSPGEFVALAETTALVTPMTRWVIDAATRQAAVWQARGSTSRWRSTSRRRTSRKRISSSTCCSAAPRAPRPRPDRARNHRGDQRRAQRRGAGAAADAAQPRLLDRDRRLRLRIQQHELPDAALRAHAEDRPKPGARRRGGLARGMLVSNIVQMGRDLGYRVVAEGVETEEERALLTGWGCDYGQDWHFGRPMSAGAFGGMDHRRQVTGRRLIAPRR